MKPYLIFSLTFFFLSSFTQAQIHSNSANYNRATSSILQELRPKPANPRNQYYYHHKDWFVGEITLNNDRKIENQPMRYEILRNQMEVAYEDQVLLLEGRKIKSFEVFNSKNSKRVTFIPCAQFELEDDKILGFFEVLADGEIQLLSHKSVVVFGATNSVALSGSHRQNSVFIKERFFVKQGNQVKEVGKRRKQDLQIFGDKATQVKKYANRNGLIFKRKADLVEIVKYYNSNS